MFHYNTNLLIKIKNNVERFYNIVNLLFIFKYISDLWCGYFKDSAYVYVQVRK